MEACPIGTLFRSCYIVFVSNGAYAVRPRRNLYMRILHMSLSIGLGQWHLIGLFLL